MQVKLNREKMGITCVENYLVWCLQDRGFDVGKLYCSSFISIDKALDDFTSTEIGYENYEGISRLQDIGHELGCISKKFYKNVDKNDLINLINENKQNFLLAGMIPEFIKERFNVSLWREDHFICINEIKDGEVLYMNDTPSLKVADKMNQIINNFNGTCIVFYLKNNFNSKLFEKKINDTIKEIILSEIDKASIYNMKSIRSLRDAVGILRISRRRIKIMSKLKCFKKFIKDTNLFENSINEIIYHLDKFFSVLEYYNLKRKNDFSGVKGYLEIVKTHDEKWRNLVKI